MSTTLRSAAQAAEPRTDAHTTSIGHFIDGRAIAGGSGREAPVYDPATGKVRAQLALADAAETGAAVAAARRALPAWSATPPLSRARVLFRFKALIEAHADELARLITLEHGKVLSDARGEVIRGLEVVEFACGIPHLLRGDFTENVGTGIDSWSMRQSVGVCAGITPFNFPAMVPMWMFPVAIACGNTFVLKPSEKDPSCPLRLAELLTEAGLPDGVLNVINGDREAVDTAAHASGRGGGELCGLYTDRRARVSDGVREQQARAGAGRRKESHGGDARCRHQHRRERPAWCSVRIGRRALYGDFGCGGGR
jgi:malonate-semialdehyde dehydrogenase (acetylating)/methylmalonate-semialdehyde dehydrogenase